MARHAEVRRQSRLRDGARLRMRSGQGVAGRVFATREPCAIEDYIRSEVISRDFFDLARAERVKSALAVPLAVPGRSHRRSGGLATTTSQFTPQHTAELATLANLASLAIENVGSRRREKSGEPTPGGDPRWSSRRATT